MYTQLFTRLALTGNGASEVSQPVTMYGANAAQLDIVVFSLSGSSTPTVTCQLQESNDLENWSNKGSTTAPIAVGYTLATKETGLAAGYLRVKVTLSGTTPISVVAIGLNTSLQ
jgi:hypothetical protein